MAEAEFIAVVLAGGASSRMGTDKALLTLADGRTLLQAAIDCGRAAGAATVIVSGQRPGHDSVADDQAGRGPLGGLQSVTRARPELRDQVIVAYPIDMPGLAPEQLVQLAQTCLSGAPAARFEQSPLPLAFRVTDELLTMLDQALAGDASVKSLARQAGATHLALSSPQKLDNVNTPEDWQRLAARTNPP